METFKIPRFQIDFGKMVTLVVPHVAVGTVTGAHMNNEHFCEHYKNALCSVLNFLENAPPSFRIANRMAR